SGYFNVQTDPTPGIGWNLELYFDDDGTGYFGGQVSENFVYTPDTWFMVKIIYNLDAGTAQVLFDDVLIVEFVNAMTIGGIDYYGADSGGDPGAFYDDVCFGEFVPDPCDNFDQLTVGDYVAVELSDRWTTWSNAPGSAEDALITDVHSNSPNNSFVVEGTTDLVRLFAESNLTVGKYSYSHYMYVPDNYCGYFNLQKDVIPGVEWGFQVQFDVDGIATVDAGAAAAATFTFPFETWFHHEVIVDINTDWAEYFVDGVLIIGWQWTLGTFGTPGANTLGAANIYAWASGGNSPLCYFDDVCFVILEATGIGDDPVIAEVTSTNIYPNPARDHLTIESNKIIEEVRIYNNMGQLVYSGQFGNSQIMVNTSNFITGMYIVQVRSGEAVEVRKLIIE
ncbi:MAG: T9SS type A sorting domain-containing protein, partial [Bacteroidales bacterium]|nr:T9SS type A sorting domain-containing protein [Bacteroidales bacterium]